MKKKFILCGIAALIVTGCAIFCFKTKSEPEPELHATQPTPIVLEITTQPKVKETLEEKELFFHLISKEDSRGILRNYWVVYNKENEIIYEAEEIRVEKYVIAQEGLNLRNLPTLAETSLKKSIPYRTEVYSLGEGEEWSLVEYNDERYFCATEFLSLQKPKAIADENAVNGTYTASEFKHLGVIRWGGWKWTWYSQRVLPGGGLDIPGRHVDSNGYVCDAEGYICLASSKLSKGTVVNTPFGKAGKVYDSGCAADTLDVYTDF